MTPLERASREILRTKELWERCWEMGLPKWIEDQAYQDHMEAIRAYGELAAKRVEGIAGDLLEGLPRNRK